VATVIAAAALFFALSSVGSGNVNPFKSGPAVKGVPPGAVLFLARRACPSGWKVFKAARGRYIVGVPNRGTFLGTDGTPLRNLEDRPTGEHTHSITDAGHGHDLAGPGAGVILNVVGNDPNVSNFGLAIGQGPYVGDVLAATFTRRLTGQTAAGPTGIKVDPAGSVPGTNAPYIQLLPCEKK
jgi:hypothetical protein